MTLINRSRHVFFASLLAFVLASAAPPVAMAGVVVKYKSNGSFLSLGGSDASGCIWFDMYVSRGGTKANPQTWMYYNIADYCSGEWLGSGDGVIPNTAFKATAKAATLSVTPSSLTNFNFWGVTGAIQLSVKPNGVYTYSFSGHHRAEYGNVMVQSHGSSTFKQIAGGGRAFGFEIPSVGGELGEGRDKYVEIVRGVE
jgi:hypothetical protein